MKDEKEGGGEHPEGEGGDCLGGRRGGRGLSEGCWRMWPGWKGVIAGGRGREGWVAGGAIRGFTWAAGGTGTPLPLGPNNLRMK